MPLFLSANDLKQLLPMEEVIQAVEEAFRVYAQGRCRVPLRQAFEVEAGILFSMPSFMEGRGLGVKVVSVFEENPSKGLPTVMALYLLSDGSTGELLAVMDGTYLTGVRTGAASGVASRYLARRDSKILGLFGSGAQAHVHLQVMMGLFPVGEVWVFSRRRERALAFVSSIVEGYGVKAWVASDPKEVVGQADILVTATTSQTPVFKGNDVRPGTHIVAVGAFTPTTRELDEEAVARSYVVVDTYEGALAEAGDLLIPLRTGKITRNHIKAELAEVVTGQKPGRSQDSEITLFKSVGFAIEDLAAASLAYERAKTLGIGSHFIL